MKKPNNELPTLYLWSQAKDTADTLATWAYATLIKPESPRAKTYPLHGASSRLLRDGSWGLILPQPKEAAQTNKTAESIGFSQQPKEILDSFKVRQQLDEIAEGLRKASDFSKRYYSPGFIAEDLRKAVSKANKLLAELAGTGKWAAEKFWLSTLEAVIELENLSFRADTLPALQAVARKQTMWPVVYPKTPGEQMALKKRMKRLGLGTQSILKTGSTSRRSTSGKFARRIGLMLWEVHFDGNLRQCIARAAVMKSVSPQDRELAAKQFGASAVESMVVRTPDADSPQKWEARLVAQGWPRWIIRLHQLPELTADSAEDWFEVGWEALKEATGGDVTQNRELAALGKSNAEYGRRRATTKRGQTGAQRSRAEGQIKLLLKKAFVARFGNEVNFQTNRNLKNP